MATETELKLSLPRRDVRRLMEHPRLTALPSRQHLLRNTYYDTPRQELLKLGVAVRFRQIGRQWLLTVKSAEPAGGGLARRSEWESRARPGCFDFSSVDVTELRHRLEALAPQLQPIFTTHFRRTTWTIDAGSARIELALDRGNIRSGDRRHPISEVEMELVEGDVGGLFTLARELQADLPLRPMVASKAERGYALAQRTPPAPFRAQPTPLTPEMTPGEAFRAIAFACLEQLQRNEVLGRAQTDPEFVHQARVALRRLRSALKLFAPVLPETILAYGEVWKILAATLGEARNWDIFLSETLPALEADFPGHAELHRLRRGGQLQGAKARRTVEQFFSDAEYSRCLLGFTAALATPPKPEASTVEAFARQRLDRLARRARRLARRNVDGDRESWHQLRIRLKELRYAVEFFSPLLPRRRLKPYAAALARLQDELGLANDHHTASLLIGRLHRGPAGLAEGWVGGRTALLIVQLPDAVEHWLDIRPPWKCR